MLQIIKSAIEDHRTLRIDYLPGKRSIEPHALGYSADGNLLLRAFQTEGASESGEHKNWKLFRVDRVGNVDPDRTGFNGPRPGYRRDDKAMTGGIVAQL